MSSTRLVPHEASRQGAVYTLWPADEDLWGNNLIPARDEFAYFLELLAVPDRHGDSLSIIIYAATDDAEIDAKARCAGFASILRASYGDVWARDTGPIFVKNGCEHKAVRFQFNGWGGKYNLPGDQEVGAIIADHVGVESLFSSIVCEGGALEFDGEGTLLTTRQCVLNPNRNPCLSEAQFEVEVQRLFGVERIIWLDKGLVGDHTDGHIDNLARFAAPGRVVCQKVSGQNDPNRDCLGEIEHALRSARDAKGRTLELITIPSPGLVQIDDEIAAASHMNWVIGRSNLILPAYNHHVYEAAESVQCAFPTRKVEIAPSHAILTGGGSFHCVTCHYPA